MHVCGGDRISYKRTNFFEGSLRIPYSIDSSKLTCSELAESAEETGFEPARALLLRSLANFLNGPNYETPPNDNEEASTPRGTTPPVELIIPKFFFLLSSLYKI